MTTRDGGKDAVDGVAAVNPKKITVITQATNEKQQCVTEFLKVTRESITAVVTAQGTPKSWRNG